MNAIQRVANRRQVLKGMLGGAAISVGLPFLDGFLNTTGSALAATGAPLPVRFGTWFWGMGLRPGRWEPKKIGENYEMTGLLRSLTPFKDRINILSGMNAFKDASPLLVHRSGLRGCCSGEVGPDLPSIDTLVSDVIGNGTRFRSLEVAASGAANAASTYASSISQRSAASINPSETSPVALYQRIFGPDFRDPNTGVFKPDPRIMVRQSVLSAIKGPRESLMKVLGAADRVRMDEYFTSLRQLENQVALQLEKPQTLDACVVPQMPANVADAATSDVELIAKNHRLLTQLLAHAIACDQTRVINVWFGMGEMRRPGDAESHHTYTHDEPVDKKLGYQPTVAWFEERQMENFAVMLKALADIKEGAGTLLDNALIFAFSEHGLATLHDLDNIPMFLAGRAGGRMKAGVHIAAKNEPVTRVGLTIQQIMGVPASSWGIKSMNTSTPFDEIVA